ncbi:3-isopropylmalate dehydratase small subunit [Streptomyces sp. 110]|uniref:3-isopropylmalate dehydratase small subunit n=1 Tax=Streptomyces endocoffeicus TaxID=2898945 RepID=A0ABS1PSV5_9ACTN|nr:3-isopropylmalate dehydratase small subunit [Streptomyces endocoffeicus]MBL1114997.1 3-isopropylmalate dehydratase small subunit [Streptomyces endocoffeicus]
MEPLRSHTGRCLPLRRSNVDTDQIIPSEYCRSVRRTGYADALFARWRTDPDFVLEQPERAGATVLLAGAHFATGSSREHAVWALRDWGVAAVIAPSFGDIFCRNALKNGLLAVALPDRAVASLLERAERDAAFETTLDLVECRVSAGEQSWAFDIDARARRLLLAGHDDITATLTRQDAIARHERTRPHWLPALTPGSALFPTEQS